MGTTAVRDNPRKRRRPYPWEEKLEAEKQAASPSSVSASPPPRVVSEVRASVAVPPAEGERKRSILERGISSVAHVVKEAEEGVKEGWKIGEEQAKAAAKTKTPASPLPLASPTQKSAVSLDVLSGLGDKSGWVPVPLRSNERDSSGKRKVINPGKLFTLWWDDISDSFIVTNNQTGRVSKVGDWYSTVATFRRLEGRSIGVPQKRRTYGFGTGVSDEEFL